MFFLLCRTGATTFFCAGNEYFHFLGGGATNMGSTPTIRVCYFVGATNGIPIRPGHFTDRVREVSYSFFFSVSSIYLV